MISFYNVGTETFAFLERRHSRNVEHGNETWVMFRSQAVDYRVHTFVRVAFGRFICIHAIGDSRVTVACVTVSWVVACSCHVSLLQLQKENELIQFNFQARTYVGVASVDVRVDSDIIVAVLPVSVTRCNDCKSAWMHHSGLVADVAICI
jgi:phenolic acid decarboxylase